MLLRFFVIISYLITVQLIWGLQANPFTNQTAFTSTPETYIYNVNVLALSSPLAENLNHSEEELETAQSQFNNIESLTSPNRSLNYYSFSLPKQFPQMIFRPPA